MRRRLTPRLAGIAGSTMLLGWVGGCKVSPGTPPPASSSQPAPRSPTSATIISSSELAAMNRPLLDIMRQRLPGMQVTQSAQGCPDVTLRGKSSVSGSSSPAIYVDGTQSSNTCILNELRTVDLEQVEVYPGGVPPRAGYRAHPYGVILIFVKRS